MLAPRPQTFRRVLLASLLVVFAAAPSPAAPTPAPSKKPVAAPTSNATGPVELIEELEGARVNWTTGRLTVSGVGTPGDRGPMAFRRTLSARAAMADAYRRMAQTLEVVRVDANTRLKDLAVVDDALRSRLNDFVKSAKVLETNYWPDGSAEVVLGIDLKGDRSLSSLMAGSAPAAAMSPGAGASLDPSAGPSIVSLGSPVPDPSPTKEIVSEPVAIRANYSSLIVDARGLGAQPALLPNVRDNDAKVIDLETGASRAGVKYLRDGAELDGTSGLNPLKLRAVRTQGPLRADLVLTPDATAALKAALRDKKLAQGATVLIQL